MTERMKHNLGITRGLIVAEAVMMSMAPFTGRQQAHRHRLRRVPHRERKGRHAGGSAGGAARRDEAFRPRRDRAHDRSRQLSGPRAAHGGPGDRTFQRYLNEERGGAYDEQR